MSFLQKSLLLFAALMAGANATVVLAAQHLYVSSGSTSSVPRYDGATGAYLDTFIASGAGGLNDPRGIAFGPDRNLYVASYRTNSVLRFNGDTGAFMDSFVPAGSGGLSGPSGMAFGPDGHLYVTSTNSNRVLRFDGSTGVFLNVFASFNLSLPVDLAFGPDLAVYVVNQGMNNIIKFSATGSYLSTFIQSGSGGLNYPSSLRFGPDGNLYVASQFTHAILKFDGKLGTFLGVFASGNGLNQPSALAFGPDADLYVVSSMSNSILRFNGISGAFINTFVSSGSGGLSRPRALVFAPVALNQAPIAHAGRDQTLNEGVEVILDGSLSSDPENDVLSYQWAQVSGPVVNLNLQDPVRPKFFAPTVSPQGSILTFQLIVNDGKLSSAPALVTINIANVNQVPTAVTGGDQSVSEGAAVTLDGSASFDPDGDWLDYEWTQVAGPSVQLDLMDPVHPRFQAPYTGATGAVLRFELRVFDGALTSTAASVQVAVNNVNRPPVANGGADSFAYEGDPVTLDGSLSSDPDGDSLIFQWVQIAGPQVTLDLTAPAAPKFTAPSVGREGALLTFQLSVSDGAFTSASSLVNVSVMNVNRPPVANAGQALTVLEQSFVSLDGSASTDSDGDALTYSWTQVSGPAVSLNVTNPVRPTFVAPSVTISGAILVFELMVDDGISRSSAARVTVEVTNDNHAPSANAGADRVVNEGTSVTLNGTGSSDPDGDLLSYRWTQIAGPTVVLNAAESAQPSFTAPMVDAGTTLTFQLIVSDSVVSSAPAVVSVAIKDTNHAPIANAGIDQSVGESTLVTLNGVGSYDPDGDAISYRWVQVEGPRVSLYNPTAMQPSFTTPVVTTSAVLKFSLTVSDGFLSSQSTVSVTVQHLNHAPVANAGDSFTAQEGTTAVLDGSRSVDADGDALTYTWVQTQGPEIALNLLDPIHPRFTAPDVSTPTPVTFILTVSDGTVISAPSSVTVTVTPVNGAPVCDRAIAKPAVIWPPTHKLIRTEITGISDPNNNPVAITILGVTQDEPTQGLGDGDTAVDAVLNGANVLLRAERAGAGNGRVYSVAFKALNSSGGSCTGRVSVCVPKDSSAGCIDDGQNFNSMQ